MKYLAVPAGAAVRFTASARPGLAVHRWDVAVSPTGGGAPRLNLGSHIGQDDLDQRIDIPAQTVDCELEIDCCHATARGWGGDLGSIAEESEGRLVVGFCDPDRADAGVYDVVLNFIVAAPSGSEH
jgi:hypothetical protein